MVQAELTVGAHSPAVRPPRQDRSRLVWRRILDAGLDVLCDLGVARFTISAVCDRAEVAMTAVYARVDSRDDLLHAVYDHGIADLQATEARLSAAAVGPDPGAAVDVLADVFVRHAALLRRSILGANDDAYLLVRGQQNLSRARDVFVRTAVGHNAPAERLQRARTLFTAAVSTLSFELAFGPRLVQGDSGVTTVSELRAIAAALLPDRPVDQPS